jgi:hypothetical protein
MEKIMKNRTIKVSIKRTINLGNFENESFEIGYEREVSQKDDISEVFENEFDFLTEEADKIETIIRERNE